jgi:alpha-1,2-mannosyltransferase
VGRVLRGEALYAPAQFSGPYSFPSTVEVGYSYPPPSVLFFLPFASNPWGLIAYTGLSVAILLSGLLAIVRRELGHLAPGAGALVLLLVHVLPGYLETVRYGNVNLFIAGVFAWMWVLPAASRPVGIGLGAAILLKLFPGLFLGWSMKHAGLRHAFWAAVLAATAAIVSLPLVGLDAWPRYVAALGNAEPACHQAVSLTCLLLPLAGVAGAKTISLAAALVLAGTALLVRSRLAGFALLAAATLMPVLELWGHYGLFIYVVLVAAFSRLAAGRWVTERRATADAPVRGIEEPGPETGLP